MDDYRDRCRQHYKMNPETISDMCKKAERMKQRKISAEQLAEANRKHDEQFSAVDVQYSKAVKNSVYSTADTPAEAGRPMRAHLGMTTKPTGKDRLF